MIRATLLLVVLLLGGAVAQEQNEADPGWFTVAVRVSPCMGWIDDFTPLAICSVGGFVETPEFGVFAQVRPPVGDWHVYAYVPRELPLGITAWPGVALGRESGGWFARIQADLIWAHTWQR